MNLNPSFDALLKNLLARGLSPAYARRYVQELADHREDLLVELEQHNLPTSDAQRLADERLGSADMLAHAALSKYQSQTFMGRHPRLFFAVLPFLMVPLFFSLIIIIIAVLLAATHLFDQGIPLRFQPLCMRSFYSVNTPFPPLSAFSITCATRRRALSRSFRISTSVAVILWATFFSYSIGFQSPNSPHGHLMIGLGTHPNILQSLAVAVPILLYARFANRFSQRPTLAS